MWMTFTLEWFWFWRRAFFNETIDTHCPRKFSARVSFVCIECSFIRFVVGDPPDYILGFVCYAFYLINACIIHNAEEVDLGEMFEVPSCRFTLRQRKKFFEAFFELFVCHIDILMYQMIYNGSVKNERNCELVFFS